MRVSFKFILLLFFLLPILSPGFSQDEYAVSKIPIELKANAKAVVRIDETIVEVVSINKIKIKRKLIITILNENGLDASHFNEVYDKFSRISSVDGTVFDSNGKKIRRIPNNEIFDFSAISGFASFDDNRRKVIDPKIATFPSTVEYIWEESADNLRYIPDWHPYFDFNISIQSSTYSFSNPLNLKIRYLERNFPVSSDIKTIQENNTVSWKLNNLSALKMEYFSLSPEEYTPTVVFSPSEFEFAKTSGNAASWKEIGDWVWQLNHGRDVIPEATQTKIIDLISDATTDIEKTRRIYDYLQNNTRYYNISLGIGGFQPFEAEVVDRLAYGDCKALSNYMYSLLKIAGIKSYYTLVNAGNNNLTVIPDFPSIRFNHAFLCIPLDSDTLWLECTSQTAPFGYLGKFTDDRAVLLIKEDGGHLVHSKAYTAEENTKSTKAIVNLEPEGLGQVFISRKYQGQYYDDIEPVLRSDNADKKKIIYDMTEIPDFKLNSYKYDIQKNTIPIVFENLDLFLGNYATVMGINMFLPVNLLNKYTSLPKCSDERKSDIYMPRAITEIDTIIYNLPEGYTWSGAPEQKEIISDFGKYNYQIIPGKNQVIYTRKMILNKGRYPKTDYTKLYEFFDGISVSDQKKIALKKI